MMKLLIIVVLLVI
ncbi:hypothetical protein OUM07_001470 [Escherichia coli]|nr:hypothetical protein [Escherichia coli]